MQHGQRIVRQPVELLRRAGFNVVEVPDGFMCCGSAGVYNLLQPDIAGELKQRKVANIRSVRADVAATGNIGCMTQLSGAIGIPMVHTVELLDWATGGPEPEAMRLTVAMPKEPVPTPTRRVPFPGSETLTSGNRDHGIQLGKA